MVLSFRWNYSIADHCSDALRRELPREPLPTNRAAAKAPVQTSACNGERMLPPAVAIMSSSHDPNENGDLPEHALPERRMCSDRVVNV